MDELSANKLNQIQKGLNLRVEGLNNTPFPDDTDPVVAGYIERFYLQMVKEKQLDVMPKSNTNKD